MVNSEFTWLEFRLSVLFTITNYYSPIMSHIGASKLSQFAGWEGWLAPALSFHSYCFVLFRGSSFSHEKNGSRTIRQSRNELSVRSGLKIERYRRSGLVIHPTH